MAFFSFKMGAWVLALCLGVVVLPVQAQKEVLEADDGPRIEVSDTAGRGQTETVIPNPSAANGSRDSGIVIAVAEDLRKNADKNLGLALLGAAVLPGLGEIYLREPDQAKPFLLVEAGLWASVFLSLWSRDSYLQSARNQASEYAGIDASSKGEAFLNTMSDYRSYREKEHRNDSYELAQILSGKRDGNYGIPATAENDWDFGSSNTPENTRHWKSFQATLRYYRASKVALTFAVGGLAMNRLVALAHTMRLYRHSAGRGLAWHFLPDLGPETAGGHLAVSF